MSSNPRTFLRSFAGGELTPEFFGHIDDAKFQTGLRTCRNFVVKPHGPVENRAGTAMVREVKDSTKKTRIIPFVYASDQSLVIEVGAGYFRFHTQGATVLSGGVPYEVTNPYAQDDLAGIKFLQSNDVVTLTHSGYPPAELRRLGATNWTYTALSFASALSPPTGITASATPATTSPGTPTLQSYVVTAVKGADESASSATGTGAQPTGGSAISSMSNANPGLFTSFDVPATDFVVGEKVYISGCAGVTGVNDTFFYINTYNVTYDDSASASGFTFTLKDASGTAFDTTSIGTYTGGGKIAHGSSAAGIGSCSNNLYDTGAYNTLAWSAVSNAERYYVYKQYNGLFGYIGQTTDLSFKDDDIAADVSKTPPITNIPFTAAGDYPAASGYFEQRRCFAGTANNPAKFWATRSATESNLSYSIPGRDDDAVIFSLAARERQAIRHIIPLSNLILLTESSEWRVAPDTGTVLTPSVSVRQQSAIGTADAPPVIVNNNLLFAAARGGHVRELAYNWQANGYITGDLSLRAPHLFDGYSIVDMAYAKAPIPIVWAVSSSGSLLGLTYVPEQEVGGWHRHDTTGGVFEHIAVVPEGAEDVLYAVVKRDANRFIERMASRANGALADAFFVDCGISQTFGAPVSAVSGLDWLEGQTVSILADGAVHPQQVVTGGAISLQWAASKITVGLPIEADIETLPIAVQAIAFGQGQLKNVSRIFVRVFQSSAIAGGPSFDKLTEYKQRTTEAYGTSPAPVTAEISFAIGPSWGTDGQVCLRQSQPLPLTVVSLVAEFAAGGG